MSSNQEPGQANAEGGKTFKQSSKTSAKGRYYTRIAIWYRTANLMLRVSARIISMWCMILHICRRNFSPFSAWAKTPCKCQLEAFLDLQTLVPHLFRPVSQHLVGFSRRHFVWLDFPLPPQSWPWAVGHFPNEKFWDSPRRCRTRENALYSSRKRRHLKDPVYRFDHQYSAKLGLGRTTMFYPKKMKVDRFQKQTHCWNQLKNGYSIWYSQAAMSVWSRESTGIEIHTA